MDREHFLQWVLVLTSEQPTDSDPSHLKEAKAPALTECRAPAHSLDDCSAHLALSIPVFPRPYLEIETRHRDLYVPRLLVCPDLVCCLPC